MGYQLADPKLHFKFVDTSDEIYRTYTFPGYDTITITGTLYMAVGNDNFHRLFDGTKGHMIPPSWIHLEWEVDDGGTIFKF